MKPSEKRARAELAGHRFVALRRDLHPGHAVWVVADLLRPGTAPAGTEVDLKLHTRQQMALGNGRPSMLAVFY